MYSKSSEFSREAGGISGPSKADGWCLCFGPGPFPVAHPGRGTVQGPEPMAVAHHSISEVSPAPLNSLHSQSALHSIFGYFSAPVLPFFPRVLPFSQLRAEPLPQLLRERLASGLLPRSEPLPCRSAQGRVRRKGEPNHLPDSTFLLLYSSCSPSLDAIRARFAADLLLQSSR